MPTIAVPTIAVPTVAVRTVAVRTVAVRVRLVLALLVLATAGCAPNAGSSRATGTDPAEVVAAGIAAGVPRIPLTLIDTAPHDTQAWTEGFEIADGLLYEGTGLAGRSELRELDPVTGAQLRATALPGRLYGEGITVIGPRIWQLTWRDGVALEWDRRSLTPGRQVPLTGATEGWGLCHTGDDRVVSSDGGDLLRVRDPADLAVRATVPVTVAGKPLTGLNELECVPGAVWANVYRTDWLVRIDLATGAVNGVVDAGGLLSPDQRGDVDVLNGIAAVPGTDEFLLTGKFWPTTFRVRLGG